MSRYIIRLFGYKWNGTYQCNELHAVYLSDIISLNPEQYNFTSNSNEAHLFDDKDMAIRFVNHLNENVSQYRHLLPISCDKFSIKFGYLEIKPYVYKATDDIKVSA